MRTTLVPVLCLMVMGCATPGTESPGDAPAFTDVREETGLGGGRTGFRVTWTDYNSDTFPDIAVRLEDPKARNQLVLLESRPSKDAGLGRQFVDVTGPSLVLSNRKDDVLGRQVCCAAFGDVDNDGDQDLVTPVYYDESWEDLGDRSEVLLNDGHGVFHFAPESDLQRAPPMTTAASCFLDYDRDGKLDLFTIYWYRSYEADYKGGRMSACSNRLWKGLGDGRFKDVSEEAGVLMDPEEPRTSREAPRPAYGVMSCDFDNDGDPDVFVSCYGRSWNLLWSNNGDGTFTDVAEKVGYDGDSVVDRNEPAWHENGNTFMTSPDDFDRDGDLDLYLAEVTHSRAIAADESCLLVNQGAEKGFVFVRDPGRIIRERGGGMGRWDIGDHYATWLDFDNDGRRDLLVAPGTYVNQFLALYRQREDGQFDEIGAAAGVRIQNPEGLSVGDFDRDGDEDIVCTTGPGRYSDQNRPWTIHLFRNNVGNRNRWINIRLQGDGTTSNRDAIGARVWVTAGGVTQMQEVGGGRGQGGTHDGYDLRFGLGSCEKIDELRVRWPDKDGTIHTMKDVETNVFLGIDASVMFWEHRRPEGH